MAEEANRPRLGRGLAALIGEVGDEMAVVDRARGQRRVPIEFLRPNPRNPRKTFNSALMNELVQSVRQRGVIQPIIVRALPNVPDAYEIVAGERRWRAAQQAGLHEVPVVQVDIDDKTALEYAIIENVQRTDLNAIEEAQGYRKLMEEFGYKADDIGQLLAKSRSHVANTMRLLNLPESVQALVISGHLTAGHARALLAVQNPEAVAKDVVDGKLTVRQVEEIAHQEAYGDEDAEEQEAPRPARGRPEKDPDTRALEKALEDVLGLGVAIRHKGEKGELRIKYASLDQLDGLCRRLKSQLAS